MSFSNASNDIYTVLETAGIETCRGGGKLDCPRCGKRHIWVFRRTQTAKCFTAGCSGFWSVHNDAVAPKHDWAIYVVAEIAEQCQARLPRCQVALDYLQYRKLPIEPNWLMEQDLGAVPGDLDVDEIIATVRRLWREERKRREDRMSMMSSIASGRGKKAAREAAKLELMQLEIDEEEKEVEHLTESILPCLEDQKWRDALVYIYRDSGGHPCSLNIRQIKSEPEARQIMRVQPQKGRRGVFGVGDVDYAPGEGWGTEMPALTIVEGEHNLLALRAAFCRWGLKFFIPAVAVGGKNGADVSCIRELCEDLEPLIVYDNDTIKTETGKPGGYDLVDAVSALMYCTAATTPTKDLDDYLKTEPTISPRQLHDQVFSHSRRVPMKIEVVRNQVASLLRKEGMEENGRQIAVTQVIAVDVMRRTQVYAVDGYAMLVRPDGDLRSQLIPVRHGNPAFHRLMREYGLAENKWLDAAGRTINIVAADLSTPRRELHSLSCWHEGALYINCYDGSMIRIAVAGEKPVMKRVPVGTDGILMQRYTANLEDLGQKVRPWLTEDTDLDSIPLGSLRHREDSVLERHVLGTIEYADAPGVYKQLLKAWLLSIFFGTAHRNRLIAMIEGTPGAGKSAFGAHVGHILIGPAFSVGNSPANEREVAELMTGTPFVVFDEWNSIPKSVEAAIRHLTTGGKHRRRELYTTSQMVELSCDAAVVATTNANALHQAGSQRRFLVVPVNARQKNPGESVYKSEGDHLIPQLMSVRAELWRELLGDLAACVAALHHTDPATSTSCSMSDFGVFVERMAEHEGWREGAKRLFIRTEQKQEDAAAESQDLVALFTELLTATPKLSGQFRSAREWADLLQGHIREYEVDLTRRVNANYIAWACKAYKDLFGRRLGMTCGENRHTKTKNYAFRLPSAEGATA